MQFDNQGFEKGVSTTMKSLKNLNESLKMKNATNGLTNVSSGINSLTSMGIGALSSGVDAVSTKFNALGIIAATALMNITNRAIETGRKISNMLTIEPITSGFSEYETKMNAIQTILTNTASKGTTMEDVTAVLAELNKYSDQTIYNFADMTKNIGTFTAAGIDLETSATAIKGIANLAAGSGSNAQQASTAMYQLSQALAAGKVSLQDWNSVVNAGMGGELFKNALMDTAKQMGIYVDKSKPFRETLQDGWLTAKVLTKTLTKFAEDESLLKAATEVKTFTQLIDTMKESVSSGWATSWEYIVGDKEQAAEFFTAISDGFNKIIQPSTDARNSMLKFWNEHGGRTAIIEGLSNVMQSFQKVMRGISMAWEMVFPPMTGQRLVELSEKFKDLTEKFKITDQTAGKIGAVFKGFLDTVLMVKDGVVALFKGMKPLKEAFSGMGSGILDSASKIGLFFSELRNSIKVKGIFESIADGSTTVFTYIGSSLMKIKDAMATAWGYISSLNFSGFFEYVKSGFSGIKEFLQPVIDSISKVIDTINFDTLFGLIKAGSAIEIVKQLKNMFTEVEGVADTTKGVIKNITKSFKTLGELGTSISDTLASVRETLEDYQKNLQAGTLIKIAAAIAILAASLILIASIDPKKMATGLAGMAGLFAELTASFLVIAKFGTGKGMMAMMTIGGTMRNIALGVLILAGALTMISKLNPEQLTTGILGLTVTMGLMVASAKLLQNNMKGMFTGSAGLIVFAGALMLMSVALEKLGSVDVEVMGNGLGALGVLLLELAAFMAVAKFGSFGPVSAAGILILALAIMELRDAVLGFGLMQPEQIIKGLSALAGVLGAVALFSAFGGGGLNLIALGVGLNIVSEAMLTFVQSIVAFEKIKWEQLGISLTAMAGGLLIFGAAAALISGPKLLSVAVGVGVMSAALLVLTEVLTAMGKMTWDQIGAGIFTLSVSLSVLALAMYAMTGCISGALAMVVMAGALAVLTPQLLILSQMSLTGVGIALLALAGAFTILGLAGLVLTPLIPTLLGLAGAIALLGVGALACGAGLSMIGTGLGLVGVAVGGSGLLIVEFLKQLINLLPQLGTKLGEMIVNLAGALGTGLTEITKAIETILMALLTAIQNVLPKIVEVAMDIVVALAQGLARGVPAVTRAALELVLGVLQAIADNIQQIIEAGADCVIGFMDGLASKLPEVIQSGINLALSFIEGVADGLTNNKERMGEAVRKVIKAMLTTGVEVIKGGLTGFLEGGKELLGGLVTGIKNNWPKVKEAVSGAVDKAKAALANAGSKLVQAGKDLIQGLINGIAAKAYSLVSKAKGVVQNAIDAAKNLLGINSPSRVFMEIGEYTGEGLIIGLDKYSQKVANAASNMADGVIDNVKNPLSNIGRFIDGEIDINPVITPVIDLTNVENSSKRLGDMFDNTNLRINGVSGTLAGGVGRIQNRADNSDVIAALKDLKDGMSNNANTYNINGVTYDDGSNVASAVETLVRAARIERRV